MIRAVIAAAATALALIFTAPQANADEYDYLVAVNYQMTVTDPVAAVDTGWRICADLASGADQFLLAGYLMGAVGLSFGQAVWLIAAANVHLCPWVNATSV